MKNIHLISTDKPSRLTKNNLGRFIKLNGLQHQEVNENQNTYITNDEVIKEGDWFLYQEKLLVKHDGIMNTMIDCKKIILTTDQDLIADGVQAIDDNFLEWFVKNPSCESVEVNQIEQIPDGITFGMFGNDEPPTELIYKIIIPQEEPKITNCGNKNCQSGVINGVNPKICRKCNPKEEPKQETLDKKYTEENMIKFAFDTYCYISGIMKVPFNKVSENRTHAEDNFKEYIKSLNKQDK
jgi:hypothetical protein